MFYKEHTGLKSIFLFLSKTLKIKNQTRTELRFQYFPLTGISYK